MLAPATTGRSRCVKTHVGRSAYHSCHLAGLSTSDSCSSSHSYVVEPIAIAPMPSRKSPNDDSASSAPGTSNSHESELSVVAR